MESNELVSIIIPVFNVKPFLTESLESVIHQTYEKLEILIIDDGSSDGSERVCDEYAAKDRRIRVIHQENKGLSAARNKGLDMMSGEIVAFLDSDDALNPRFIEEMLSSLEQTQSDVAICKYSIHETIERLAVQEPVGIWPPIEEGTYDRIIALQALENNKINHSVWNRMYRKTLWEKIRFPKGHVYEDIDTAYRVFNLCRRISVINEPLYLYRKRSDGIANTKSPQFINDWFLAMSHFDSFVEKMTPEVFTAEQVKTRYESRMKQMTSYYVRYSRKAEGKVWNAFSNDMRQRLIECYREKKEYSISIPIQACCRMACDCPWLLKIAYPLAHYVLLFSRSALKS